jgi:hypothetical protein
VWVWLVTASVYRQPTRDDPPPLVLVRRRSFLTVKKIDLLGVVTEGVPRIMKAMKMRFMGHVTRM